MRNTLRAHGNAWLRLALLLVTLLLLVRGPAPREVSAGEEVLLCLPLALRAWPPLPEPPSLLPIDNADGDGSYTVRWTAAARADEYMLEERYGAQSWFTAYLGPATSVDLTNRPAGTYTYRCRGLNSWGDGTWSNEVTVGVAGTPPGTVSRPSCSRVNAGGKALSKVINDCPYILYLDFTGPQPLTMELAKCDVCKVYSFMGPLFCPTSGRPVEEEALLPGDYRVFVTVNNPSIRPYLGNWTLSGDCRYTTCFYIVTTWSSGEGAQRQLVPGRCE